MNKNIMNNLTNWEERESFLKDFELWKKNGNYIDFEKFNNKTFSKHVSNFLTFVYHGILKIKNDEFEEFGEKEIILFLFEFCKFKQDKKHFITYTRINLPNFSEIQINKYRKFIKEIISNYDQTIQHKIKTNLCTGICYAHFLAMYFDGNLSSTEPFLKQKDNKMYFEKMIEMLSADISSIKREIKRKQMENIIKIPEKKSISIHDFKNKFSRYTWQQAEDLVGELFRKKGYVVEIGKPTSTGTIKRQGDFGIDVEAKNSKEYLGIQVKHWNNDVGFEDVAKTLGVAQKFNKVIIVSTKSGFTNQALTHAQNNPYLIELWDSDKFKNELRQYLVNNSNLTESKGALPKEDSKFCSECKTDISDSTKFCPKCGKKQ